MSRKGVMQVWSLGAWLLAAGGALAGCTWPIQVAAIPQVAVTDAPPEVVEVTLEPVLASESNASAMDPAPTQIAPTPTPSMSGPDYSPGINPLTGLPVGDPTVLNCKPLMVGMSLFPVSAREHQAGLPLAAFGVDILDHGRMTRT